MRGLQGYDVNRGAEYLGNSYMTDGYFKMNTNNIEQGYVDWPYEGNAWWASYPIKVGSRAYSLYVMLIVYRFRHCPMHDTI